MIGLLAGIGLVGSIFSAVNQYEAGQAQAATLREQSDLDLQRSEEFLLRTERNIVARKKQAERVIGGQKVALAKAGIELGTGVSLDIMEDTYLALAEEEDLIREEAAYQAESIKSGAAAKMSQASDVSEAGKISGVTTLLSGFGRAFA